MTEPRSRKVALRAEAAFATVVAVAFVALIRQSYQQGYAAQPFIYNTFDTFMDWYNTAYWAWRPHEAFANWGTVYPPASFVFLRLVTDGQCYAGEPLVARNCDWMGLCALIGTYFMAVVCVARLYWKVDRATAPMRTVAIAFGLPLVFALERGNLIIITLVFVLLGFTPLIASARLRWLSAAAAINFKIYLVAGLAGFLTKRKWLALEGTTILTAMVYAATWTIFGEGSPAELIADIREFAEGSLTHTWQDVYYASTLTSLERLVTQTPGIIKLIGTTTPELIGAVVPPMVLATQGVTVAAILAAFLRPASAPAWRITALGIGLAITTSEAGGYTHLLVLALVFLEPWRGGLRITALVCAYLLSIPYDIMIAYISHTDQYSWWVNTQVPADFGLAVGNILRPVLMLLILCVLSLETIGAFMRERPLATSAGRPAAA